MLAQFQIPEIGYSATSITLSNTELYPYFLRVVSPDSQQAQALAELVQAFGWTYISTIHSDGLYSFFSVMVQSLPVEVLIRFSESSLQDPKTITHTAS